MMKYVITLITLLVGFISSQQVLPELVQITELVRHGARNGLKLILGTKFPADIEPSRLTPNGHRMHYNLGVTLRKKYPEIFTTKTTTSQINLYSSPVHRCQQSAASQLMGLYPTGLYDLKISVSSQSQMVLADFEGTQNELAGEWALPNSYAPFPIITNSDIIDNLFMPVEDACPTMFEMINAFRRTLDEKYLDLTKPVSDKLKAAGYDSKKLLNKDQFTLNDIAVIFDETFAYRNFYDKLPDGITEEIYDKMDKVANVDFLGMMGKDTFWKLHAHRMATEILTGMKQWVDGKTNTPPKFRLFSGHDTNVLAWMAGLGLTSLECQTKRARGETVSGSCLDIPPFASSIVLEIRRSAESQQLLVKPLLDGKIIKICKSQEESSSELCRMEEFEEITKSKLVWPGTQKNFLKACGNKYLLTDYPDEKPAAPQPQSNSNVGYLILGGAVVVLSVLVIVLWLRKPKQPDNNSTHLNEETLGLN